MLSKAFLSTAVLCSASVLGGFLITSTWLRRRKRFHCQPEILQSPAKPRKWVRVGTVKTLRIYPIKSCQGVSVEQAIVTRLGLKHSTENIRDRDFLLVDETGKQLTMVKLPKMALINVSIDKNDSLTLTAPQMPDLTFSIPLANESNQRICRIKQDAAIKVLDCGDRVATWLQTFLGKDILRLCYHHLNETQRSFEPFQRQCPQFAKSDFGSFQNATAFMMVAEESVDKLNKHLPSDRQCTWTSFRPTILISGSSEPFQEVNWSFVKVGIGNETSTTFNVAAPCFRCLLTTVDQKAGILNTDGEPLKTLRSLRISEQVVDENVRAMLGNKGVMGLLMGLYRDSDQNSYGEGAKIKVGDPVYAALL